MEPLVDIEHGEAVVVFTPRPVLLIPHSQAEGQLGGDFEVVRDEAGDLPAVAVDPEGREGALRGAGNTEQEVGIGMAAHEPSRSGW